MQATNVWLNEKTERREKGCVLGVGEPAIHRMLDNDWTSEYNVYYSQKLSANTPDNCVNFSYPLEALVTGSIGKVMNM